MDLHCILEKQPIIIVFARFTYPVITCIFADNSIFIVNSQLMIFSKSQLISEVMRTVMSENVQMMDKYYIKTGILNDNDRQRILSITNGDNYTKFMSDVYAYFKEWDIKNGKDTLDDNMFRWISELHSMLVNYDPNVFPVAGLDVYNANADKPFRGHPHGMHILDVTSALRERNYVIKAYRQLPQLYIRNLKQEVRMPNDEYGFRYILKSINSILKMTSAIERNNPDNAEKIYAKAFSSKNNTFKLVADYITNIKEYLVSDTSGIEDLKEKLSNCEKSKIFKTNGDNLYVVKVGSQHDMQILGCGSLWCFATSNDPVWWREYANGKFVYLIFDFKESRNSPQRMVVELPNGELYNMYNELTNDDNGAYDIDEPVRKPRAPKAAPAPMPPKDPYIPDELGQYSIPFDESYHRLLEGFQGGSDIDARLKSLVAPTITNFMRDMNGKQRWTVVPFEMWRRVRSEFFRYGFIRSEKALQNVIDIVTHNVLQIIVNTMIDYFALYNRWQEELSELPNDPEAKDIFPYIQKACDQYRIDSEELELFDEYAQDDNGITRATDAARAVLLSNIKELAQESDPMQQVVILDHIFDISHQRSDLASWLIEGGTASLSKLTA